MPKSTLSFSVSSLTQSSETKAIQTHLLRIIHKNSTGKCHNEIFLLDFLSLLQSVPHCSMILLVGCELQLAALKKIKQKQLFGGEGWRKELFRQSPRDLSRTGRHQGFAYPTHLETLKFERSTGLDSP